MKTQNLNINLMVPGQINKDIVFNEAILTIDAIASNAINNFIKRPLKSIKTGQKYIITAGKYKNQLYFKKSDASAPQFCMASPGCIIYNKNDGLLYYYANNEWQLLITNIKVPGEEQTHQIAAAGNPAQPATTSASKTQNQKNMPTKFKGIKGSCYLSPQDSHHYLYIENNVELIIDKLQHDEITIIFKQCHNNSFKLKWPHNVLWSFGSKHILTEISNSMDLVKLYKMPESDHYIGHVIIQNFQF